MERIIADTMFRVKEYERGVELKRITRRDERFLTVRKLDMPPRGKINDFSTHSRRRMREALASARPREEGRYELLGLCLTIPNLDGEHLTQDQAVFWEREYRRMFELWCHRIRYAFPRVGWIWRVELTEKRMPHVHLVGFVPWAEFTDIHQEGDGYTEEYLFTKLNDWCPIRLPIGPDRGRGNYVFRWGLSKSGRGCWPSVVWEARKAWLDVLGSSEGFVDGLPQAATVRAVDARVLTECVHYLCDHASKSKQAQLGWRGKQWGFINKPALVFQEAAPFDLSNHLAARLCRILERCFQGRRYHIPLPKPVLVSGTPEELIEKEAKHIREKLSALLYYNPRVCHRRGLAGVEPYEFDLKTLVRSVQDGSFEPMKGGTGGRSPSCKQRQKTPNAKSGR